MLNLTPHAITIAVGDRVVTLPPSGTVARVATVETAAGAVVIDGVTVPVVLPAYGAVLGLPEEGVPCIVSAMVRGAVPGRRGVYAPDTGATALRTAGGQIQAVVRLIAA